MARVYMSRFECAHPGCTEVANYESRTRAEQMETQKRYWQKWRCIRHSQPQQVLGPGNMRIIHDEVSRQEPHGIYWGHSGFQSGPGFRAFAKDFPPGTILRVTAEIILPDGPTAQDETGGEDNGSQLREDVATEIICGVERARSVNIGLFDLGSVYRTADQIIALVKAQPEGDKSREEPKHPPSPDTSALLAEAEDQADALAEDRYPYTAALLRRRSQALREARG